MDTNPIYLFTYSPRGVTKSYDYTYMDHYNDYFKSWHGCMAEYEINPELNASGNLHYHGYYIIKDRFKWFKKVLPKLKYNGMIKIDEVKQNFTKAIEYSRKDRELMLKLLTVRPLPITHEDHLIKQVTVNKITLLDYGIVQDYH